METKLKKAKTCDGCRASEGRNECSIGYQCTDWTPLEPCPKPKTIRQLIDSSKIKQIMDEQLNKV